MFSGSMISTTREEMMNQLGHEALIALLRDSGDEAFVSWFDGTLDNLAEFGDYRGLLAGFPKSAPPGLMSSPPTTSR
jgi:hypothetical protein